MKIWRFAEGMWVEDSEEDRGIKGESGKNLKAGEVWAVALSEEGRYLAGTSCDGRIGVWDLLAGEKGGERKKIREYETKWSFGLCVDMVSLAFSILWVSRAVCTDEGMFQSMDGRFTACGHESGNIYVFSNDTGRMLHSLPGLVKPVRAIGFSPGGKLLAAAGDARIVGLYDTHSGEQIANLTGHGSWVTSLDWSHTGEYLLSGSLEGKVKVWSIDQRTSVATHSETDKAIWSVKWLPKVGRNEGFATAGSYRSIAFYREASGG